jgi:hypothetical protein
MQAEVCADPNVKKRFAAIKARTALMSDMELPPAIATLVAQ